MSDDEHLTLEFKVASHTTKEEIDKKPVYEITLKCTDDNVLRIKARLKLRTEEPRILDMLKNGEPVDVKILKTAQTRLART
jgi:hypothetical protein